MKRTAPLIVATFALAACGQPASTTTTVTTNSETGSVTSSTSSNAPLTAASLNLQPGKWESTISVSDMELNGVRRSAPPGTGQKVTTCVTPELAAKGPDQMMRQAGMECSTNTVVYADGKVTGQRTCKTPVGTMTSVMSGTYSPTTVSVDADATVNGRLTIKEKVHYEAHRVGECG